MKKKKLNYISLFSSAGIGCFGFKNNDFENVLTAELLKERINIQKINDVSVNEGYIQGDISELEIQEKINKRINKFNAEIDVIVATPPCQSVSTLNKKNAGDIKRNSLITQSIQLVKNVRPKYFVFENVRSFLKALCIDLDGETKTVKESIEINLGSEYLIRMDVVNFKDYGTNSSRPRTLVIGTRKDLKNTSPNHIWPNKESGSTLRESIGHFKNLEKMGEYDPKDPWHFYREFDLKMLDWIKNLKEGESAFDNANENERPHKIIDGVLIPHANKMTNKYKRMHWDQIPPCVHTRSDVLAAQYTIHPTQNRVLSISELKQLMNIPDNYKFVKESVDEILSLSKDEIRKFTKRNELNIRRVIGEAVPYNIFESIARNIKYSEKIQEEFTNMNSFEEIEEIETFEAKSRFYEIKNGNQANEGAYYTPQSVVFDIVNSMKEFKKDGLLKVLEPSVGTGNFIPQLVKKIGEENLHLFVFDSNNDSIEILRKLVKQFYPNLKIEYFNEDFVLSEFNENIDVIVGNPPYITLKNDQKKNYCDHLGVKEESNNLITYFYLKSFEVCKTIYFVLPKYFLYSTEYRNIRKKMNNKISHIYDYGVDYFDVFVETIIISLENNQQKTIKIVNRKFINLDRIIKSEDLMWEGIFLPYINDEFVKIYNSTKSHNFEMFRDRQITNRHLVDTKKNTTRVIKSKNIVDDSIINIKGYDKYMYNPELLAIYDKTFNNDYAYIIPNFTYKFRIAKKPKGTITNGSIIVIIYDDVPNLSFMNSEEYKKYFLTIMSHSKFTLNLNKDIVKLLRW